MHLTPMVALVDFSFRTRTAKAGERFDATPVERIVLKARKQARVATAADDVAVDPAPDTPTRKRKRTYRRRDLVAEPKA
jgi:hypothetical protein